MEEQNCTECGSIFAIESIDIEYDVPPHFCPFCGHQMFELELGEESIY